MSFETATLLILIGALVSVVLGLIALGVIPLFSEGSNEKQESRRMKLVLLMVARPAPRDTTPRQSLGAPE